MWRKLFQNASTVCPDKMRPEASVTVPETIRFLALFDGAGSGVLLLGIAGRNVAW